MGQSTAESKLGHKLKRTLWRMGAHLSRARSEVRPSRQPAAYSVLVVCRGNYCRSPVAEGVLRTELAKLGLEGAVRVESAGTSTYYEGRRPHKYARREALRRGVDIGGHRARGLEGLDLAAFDLVIAVDERTSRELSVADAEAPILLGNFGVGADITDPNGCDPSVFAATHDAIEVACQGLARFIADQLTATSEMSE